MKDKVQTLENRVEARSSAIEVAVGDLSVKMNNVNLNIESKLDSMTSQFDEIKELIKVMNEPSESPSEEMSVNNSAIDGGVQATQQ